MMKMAAKRGGRCWFAVESKSYEITTEVAGERLKGIIVERSRGFTSWIRFGSFSLRCLLEGVEACCRGVFKQGHAKSWEDGGRRYKLEIRANEAGRYILCSVVDSDLKRFCLVFPEGKGVLGGWVLLAEKLRFLGVASWEESKGSAAFYGKGCTDGEFVRKDKKSYVEAVNSRGKKLGEAVWLQLGEDEVSNERKFLGRCLVGRWGQSSMLEPDMQAFESWGRSVWNTKGGVKFSRLGGPLLLIEFETKEEAEKVLLRGHRWFKESFLNLERWDPKVGCSHNGERDKMDEDTANFKELKWARLLVRSEGLEWPSSLQVAVGSICYSIQLWWEAKPGLTAVIPATKNEMGNEREVRDEGEGNSRAGCKMAKVRTHGEPAKVDVPCENGEGGCSKAVAFSAAMSEKVTDGVGSSDGQQIAWGKKTSRGPGKSFSLGRQMGVDLGQRPAGKGQVTEGQNDLMGMGRPKTSPYKDPEAELVRSREARALDKEMGGSGELEGEMIGSQMGSRSPAVNITELTNEALREEASRYSDLFYRPLSVLEKPKKSLSSTPSVRRGESAVMAGVINHSSSSDEVGGEVMGPLRMIWADGREAEVLEIAGMEAGVFGEKSEGVTDRTIHEDMEEREEEEEPCWQSSSLAKFSRYIGMPTEGFEGEILLLLKRMQERKIQKGQVDGRKRKKLKSSKFERELRKLEWTVNYIGEGGGEEGENTCRSK
ncbi:hypothetical protein CK203_068498 [Vitis vinifera]|uniref:DUF4283 domain-containing protein n=1 Tax=Vitis vinifera TaxID=29760 RepID=A0A438F2S3_VITVI|nr:hypothetical protein CK203_068498 [Vitis vinifera]